MLPSDSANWLLAEREKARNSWEVEGVQFSYKRQVHQSPLIQKTDASEVLSWQQKHWKTQDTGLRVSVSAVKRRLQDAGLQVGKQKQKVQIGQHTEKIIIG